MKTGWTIEELLLVLVCQKIYQTFRTLNGQTLSYPGENWPSLRPEVVFNCTVLMQKVSFPKMYKRKFLSIKRNKSERPEESVPSSLQYQLFDTIALAAPLLQ